MKSHFSLFLHIKVHFEFAITFQIDTKKARKVYQSKRWHGFCLMTFWQLPDSLPGCALSGLVELYLVCLGFAWSGFAKLGLCLFGALPGRSFAWSGLCLVGALPGRGFAWLGLCLVGASPGWSFAWSGLSLVGPLPVLGFAWMGLCLVGKLKQNWLKEFASLWSL